MMPRITKPLRNSSSSQSCESCPQVSVCRVNGIQQFRQTKPGLRQLLANELAIHRFITSWSRDVVNRLHYGPTIANHRLTATQNGNRSLAHDSY
jgi:hypothetical protein